MPIPIEILPSFLFYCYISAITPGPANICSLSTSLQKGKKAAFQQWIGIFTGFFIVSIISVFVSFFLGTALNDKVQYLSFVGAAYLVYLAIHILLDHNNKSEEKNDEKSDPQNQNSSEKSFFQHFLTGVLVQLTNVKIMLMCLTAITSFVLPYNRTFLPILVVGLFLPFTGPVANLVWLFAGLTLKRLFSNHKKTVNIVMSLSLILCAASLVISFFK